MPGSYLGRLLSTPSALDSGLPYNWNWQRPWTEVAGFLEENPIVLMDVGARGEAPPELDSLRSSVRRVGFEPDPEECRRLNQEGLGTFFPNLLAASAGRQTLRLYRDAALSSVLPLSARYERLWSGQMPVDRTLELDTVTLDAFISEHPELAPDLLKLDTQGSELEILQGAQETLRSVSLVEVEVEFSPIYEGQPLFGDVARFMSAQGFELLYLSRTMVSRSQVFQGPSRGQLLFGEALFGKREDQLEALSVERRAKYVILLCQYGHVDIACQLLAQFPDLDRVIPGVRSLFRNHANRVVRGVLMQLDKLLAVALHVRRYNQRGTDSDRAWPVR